MHTVGGGKMELNQTRTDGVAAAFIDALLDGGSDRSTILSRQSIATAFSAFKSVVVSPLNLFRRGSTLRCVG